MIQWGGNGKVQARSMEMISASTYKAYREVPGFERMTLNSCMPQDDLFTEAASLSVCEYTNWRSCFPLAQLWLPLSLTHH